MITITLGKNSVPGGVENLDEYLEKKKHIYFEAVTSFFPIKIHTSLEIMCTKLYI